MYNTNYYYAVSKGSTYLRAAAFLLSCPFVNPMTLKLEGHLDILKMYFHTENEVARLRQVRVFIMDGILCITIRFRLVLFMLALLCFSMLPYIQ